jgi:ribonuclease-3
LNRCLFGGIISVYLSFYYKRIYFEKQFIVPYAKDKFQDLEDALVFSFQNKELLREALTHRSYLNEHPNWDVSHNERLEFLGDAVLELVVTKLLYEKYPESQEGELTTLRAALVNYIMLSRVAREISLQKYILLSKGASKDNEKAWDVILANGIEALFGALYIDQGYEAAETIIGRLVFPHLSEVLEQKTYKDSKSTLQEIVQEERKVTPTYQVLEEHGPAHRREFLVGVYFGDELFAKGKGTSKQSAESVAAEQALKIMKRL